MQHEYLIPSNIDGINKDYKNKVLLGHWCSTYDSKKKNFLKEKIIKHPWEKRKNFERDFEKIQQLYEFSLRNLSSILNKHLKTKYSIRFWRILLGTWLNAFVTMYYEKKLLIKKISNKKNLCILKYDYNPKYFIADDYNHFIKISSTDEWHYYFFLELIKEENETHKFKVKRKNHLIKKPNIVESQTKNSLIDYLSLSYSKIFGFLKRKQKVVFFNTYLGKKNFYLFFKNFNFFPAFFNVKVKSSPVSSKYRNCLIKEIKIKNNFKKNLLKKILFNLPKNCFEDFNLSNSYLEEFNLPKIPKTIFTANGFYGDSSKDSLKVRYVAECVERGTKLIIAQHGGNYGNFRKCFFYNHEISISDNFLSWGWEKKNNKKIKNIGVIINSYKKIYRSINDNKDKKKLLFVVVENRKFVKSLQSESNIEGRHYYYYKFCPNFIKKFNPELRKDLVVRTYDTNVIPGKPDFGWNLKGFLKNNFKNIKISGKREEFYPLVGTSKIVVCTIFSTVFFECLLANVPTILVLPFSNEVFNKETKAYLKKLQDVKIYFKNYDEASIFLNKNWNKIDDWWKNEKTQRNKGYFLDKYCKINMNLSSDIQNLIKKNRFLTFKSKKRI